MPETRNPSQSTDDSAPAPNPGQPSDALATFRARLETGRYNVVLGRALHRTLRDAAQDPGLEAEIGALRLALARLLTEERDPSRLAAGVSRITGVAVQAARLRHNPAADPNDIQSLLLRELDAIETELAATKSPSPSALGEGLG